MGKRSQRIPQRRSEAGFPWKGRKVREMRTAETILNIIQDRGKRRLPLDDVYRQLYNPDMYLRSYTKLYKNDGAMTPGTTGETVDGMSLEKIDRVIGAIRCEQWKWPPVRRIYIEKPKGGKRPLGMPDWSPKVVQDIIRSILEAYYEPQFSDRSHGFRPKKGCQTALTEIYNIWKGTKWFIEGDMKGCFDNIDHYTLMNILRENIHDNRFLRLIEGSLKAGYCEEWTYHPSLSGSPQGGIVSPILSNIYLDRLDKFVENTLIPEHTQSERREEHPIYGQVGMYIPKDVIQAKRKRYLRDGEPIHRTELINDSKYDIIYRYQGEYRGLVNYYGMAQNLAELGYIRWTMETSLLKTLACKNQTSVMKETKRLQSTIETPEGPRKCLKLVIQREKKKPLVAIFGGLPL